MLAGVASALDGRVRALDWPGIQAGLDAHGYAVTPPLLTPAECAALVSLYGQEQPFRSTIDMARYNFGSGQYKYFARPLPALVESLRTSLYPRLAPIANAWAERLGGPSFPDDLEAFLEVCARHGQTRPTPVPS